MAASDASTLEEEDIANEEEGREAKAASLATQKAASSYGVGVDSWRGYLALATSYAVLLYIESWLIAPMIRKRVVEGIETCRCVRMHVIAEGKISLSHVIVSQ